MQKRRRRREKREYFYDYTLLFVVMFLVFFGLIMLYSTSSYEATLDFGNGAYYLKKQAMWRAISVTEKFAVMREQ